MKHLPLLVLASLIFVGLNDCARAQKAPDLAPLLALQRTTPQQRFDLKREKNDLRFMGIYGFTLDVPNIVGGQFNGIVRRYKIDPVKGSSDMIESDRHLRAQNYAIEFAEKYNRILLNYLIEEKLAPLQSEAAREIRQWETADVEADVAEALKRRDLRLLSVFSSNSKPVGVPYYELKSVEKYKTRVIGQNIRSAEATDAKQLLLIARNYASQYNYYLLRHLRDDGKKRAK